MVEIAVVRILGLYIIMEFGIIEPKSCVSLIGLLTYKVKSTGKSGNGNPYVGLYKRG